MLYVNVYCRKLDFKYHPMHSAHMKFLSTLFTALCCLAFSNAVHAETFRDRIPQELIESERSFITFVIENDMFGSGDDENYTSGLRLTYHDTASKMPALRGLIETLVPAIDIDSTSSIFYSVGQNLYTPHDITTPTPDPNDRPYAGFLYGSLGVSTIEKNHIDMVEVTLGVVGPSALGEQSQELIHDMWAANDPSGWDAQLKDEPAAMLAYQRQWPEFVKADLTPLYFRFSPYVGATVGNVYTYAATGFSMQLMPEDHKWQAAPLRIRPAMAGSGYFAVPDHTISWSLFAGAEGRAMVRNIFLDGNSYQDSPSVDKHIWVVDANAGVSAAYGNKRMAFTLNWRSKEFKNQRTASLFGALSFGYRF